MDAAAPFCEPSGECVSCGSLADGDAACAGADAMAPLCVGETCVACTEAEPGVCEGQLLLCDAETNACVGCQAHGECESGACELAEGTCFDVAEATHVDGDGGQAYTSITEAVASIDDGQHGVIVVHELDGGLPYLESVLIDGGKTIALLAAPDETPIIQGTGGNPGLRVEGAGTVLYMEGLGLVGNTMGLGLIVDEAFAWVDRGRIVQNTGGGVLAQNGAELVLRNCFVSLNGGQFTDTRGITAMNSMVAVAYTTIAANDGNEASGPVSMACDGGTSGEVRNSIVAANNNTIDCPGLAFDFNVVDTTSLGATNTVLSFDPGWFAGIGMSDFHIVTGPPFEDIAQRQSGDPPTDIDGDPRPTVDGTPDYAGADVPL